MAIYCQWKCWENTFLKKYCLKRWPVAPKPIHEQHLCICCTRNWSSRIVNYRANLHSQCLLGFSHCLITFQMVHTRLPAISAAFPTMCTSVGVARVLHQSGSPHMLLEPSVAVSSWPQIAAAFQAVPMDAKGLIDTTADPPNGIIRNN